MLLKEALKIVFLQENFLFVRKIETLLIDSANGKEVVVPQDICTIVSERHRLQQTKPALENVN